MCYVQLCSEAVAPQRKHCNGRIGRDVERERELHAGGQQVVLGNVRLPELCSGARDVWPSPRGWVLKPGRVEAREKEGLKRSLIHVL